MEYISPGRASTSRLLLAATTVLCLLSVCTSDDYTQRQRAGSHTRWANRPGHRSRHQDRPDSHQYRPRQQDPYQDRAGGFQSRAGGPNHNYGDFDYDYEESTVAQTPEFLNPESNVTVVEGQTAILPCSVRYQGTKEVAWAKQSSQGENIFFTFGKIVWVQDMRVNVSFQMGDNQLTHWNLEIKNVNMKDAGDYECQITNKSPIKKHVYLTVKPRPPPKPAAVTISGKPFVDRGEPIRLVCNATGPRVPEKIDWFKDGTKLDATSYRHGNLIIEEFMHVVDQALISELHIRHTDTTNSGTYICRSSDRKIASLTVTVLVADTTNKKRGTYAQVDAKGKELHNLEVDGVGEEEEQARDAAGSSYHPSLSVATMTVVLVWIHSLSASILRRVS
ncbi:hypothetical protein EGW08_011038 [Elysia chlorotica]|uniref:Ig-like domain-containing protein n=1 Tax=Elysia chlorotica TaxID=188477 RepID=A0A433THY6_ELYCH|nr:hypothetical protein EGW08_011038 [Elysia chlorotica]